MKRIFIVVIFFFVCIPSANSVTLEGITLPTPGADKVVDLCLKPIFKDIKVRSNDKEILKRIEENKACIEMVIKSQQKRD